MTALEERTTSATLTSARTEDLNRTLDYYVRTGVRSTREAHWCDAIRRELAGRARA